MFCIFVLSSHSDLGISLNSKYYEKVVVGINAHFYSRINCIM